MSKYVQVLKAGACDYEVNVTPDNLFQVLHKHFASTEDGGSRANQKLKESEERYRLVLEGLQRGIWDWYCATDEVYCNDRLLEIG